MRKSTKSSLVTKLILVGLPAMCLVLFVGVAPASATIITVDVNPSVSFQQTTNNPCVIGDASCKQPAGMDYTKYSGVPGPPGTESYDAYSPTYSYSALVGSLGSQTSFKIGIDENFNTNRETLYDLTVWGCNTAVIGNACTIYPANNFSPTASQDATLLAAGYVRLYEIGTTYLLDVHNGNGYSDALSESMSIAGLTTYRFVFEGGINGDNDGMEEFFLIPANATPVPEPASMFLLGTGLFGATALARRRKGKK